MKSLDDLPQKYTGTGGRIKEFVTRFGKSDRHSKHERLGLPGDASAKSVHPRGEKGSPPAVWKPKFIRDLRELVSSLQALLNAIMRRKPGRQRVLRMVRLQRASRELGLQLRQSMRDSQPTRQVGSQPEYNQVPLLN